MRIISIPPSGRRGQLYMLTVPSESALFTIHSHFTAQVCTTVIVCIFIYIYTIPCALVLTIMVRILDRLAAPLKTLHVLAR